MLSLGVVLNRLVLSDDCKSLRRQRSYFWFRQDRELYWWQPLAQKPLPTHLELSRQLPKRCTSMRDYSASREMWLAKAREVRTLVSLIALRIVAEQPSYCSACEQCANSATLARRAGVAALR